MHVFEPTGNGRVNAVWDSPVNLFQHIRHEQPCPGTSTIHLRLSRSVIWGDGNRHVAVGSAKVHISAKTGSLMTHVIQNAGTGKFLPRYCAARDAQLMMIYYRNCSHNWATTSIHHHSWGQGASSDAHRQTG